MRTSCGLVLLIAGVVGLLAQAGSAAGAPYPPSPVVASMTWHWDTLKTAAPGSDLWPVTWAGDDHLYVAWGDGGGFGGTNNDGRVAAGFARIDGDPEHFTAININGGRDTQHPADFPKAGKVDSLIAVGDQLYAWVNMQNGNWPDVNMALYQSGDRGASWRATPCVFPKGQQLRPIRFINFGRANAGVPDDLAGYVYIYAYRATRDGEGRDAYLLRVPTEKITDRAAYEFFTQLDAQDAPRWSRNVDDAKPVFTDPNGLRIAGAVYHPQLRRFLFSTYHISPGQLGVFDAPRPWGPWTTISYQDRFGDMGDGGHGLVHDFPLKWISPDGRTLWAVFSVYGDGAQQGVKAHDRFNLVKVTLEPRAAAGPTSTYFPPPESQSGWRKLATPDDIRRLAGMDPAKLDELRDWLIQSDQRKFAAVVIRHGYIALEVERDHSSVSDTGNIKSCAKAICATVLAIASEESQRGRTPRRMTFEDPAFDFIPWAQPLSDPRKKAITVGQLLNHTSGIAPESSGAGNNGPWEYIMGHTGDPKTAKLAFDPGTNLDYSTQALYHASLVCETVTGMPYDQFARKQLLEPLGISHAWFEYFNGGEGIGRHPSHAIGLSARDMARIGYCMAQRGKWGERQVIPSWFIDMAAQPTHNLTGKKSFDRDARSFSAGWELPANLSDARGKEIPADARFKPGSGGQLIAFVPSLDLVVVRQTGSSGSWEFEDYLRRACAAVLTPP
ncbi:MAG: serine hydrolase [Planctomycetes bacterium]|nr:serine hydrolase [Planctomycetota bacterium]